MQARQGRNELERIVLWQINPDRDQTLGVACDAG